MSIDLSRVDIPLKQFQDISSGKYNAGEVALGSETKLDRINHHIHFRSFNDTALSHEEVLAVKNAFVKALSSGGVDEAEIARVRHDLGLSADAAADKTLHERSLKPLTRQQVRQILDRNAEAINTHAGNDRGARVQTSEQLYGEGGMRASRAEKRDTVNASLAGAGGTEEHQGIALAEAVIAGDVDFRSPDDTKSILAQARAQRDQILQRSKGHPDANREAVVEFRIAASGQRVRIPTGKSEAAYVRKLEAMILRLVAHTPIDRRTPEVRAAFAALDGPLARREWLDGLGNAPDAGFKVRTAVVFMLTEAGIDDWETLSAVNRVDDGAALDFARTLAQLDGSLRGNDLRNAQQVRALVQLAAADADDDVPQNRRAAIPATSPKMWNEGIREALIVERTENLPHDIKALLDELPGHLRNLFGEDITKLHQKGVALIGAGGGAKEFIPDGLAEPVTAESLRAAFFAAVEKRGAETHARRLVGRAVDAAGGGHMLVGKLWAAWNTTRPELKQRLGAARSPAEIDAVFEEFREEIASDVKRFLAVERNLHKAKSFLRNALADRMGVPLACLSNSLDLVKFHLEADDLAENICKGKIPAATDAEVEAHIRAFAEKRAAHYADLLAAVDKIPNLPPALRDALRNHALDIDSPQTLDIVQVVAAARERLAARIEAIDAALVPGASKEAVYEAMAPFERLFELTVGSLFPPGKHIGAEEIFSHGRTLVLTAIFDRPGFAGKLAAFLARPDVKSDDAYNRDTPAFAAFRFVANLPKSGRNPALASSLGTTDMPPLHAQALMGAFRDAGLGDLSVAARMAVLRPSHPAGAALAAAIAAEPGDVSPSRLRELAVPILRTRAAAGGIALPPADAQRMDAALAKYDGGLSAPDRARLRQYAESLDFSEAAAKASEKALAQYLDEMCGGGDFANPASSASRRALASGYTPADLPVLYLLAERLVDEEGERMEDVVDALVNPQSDLRRRWDAALLNLVSHQPERLAALPAADKIAAARAVILCGDDADLLAIVTTGISRAIRDGVGRGRNPVAIQRIVENVRDNLAEVRAAAAGDPAALAAGIELLKGLETRAAPPGYLKHLIDAARRAPIDAISKLRRRSTPAEINRALLQLNANIVTALAGRPSGGLAEDGDTAIACRHFLLRTTVSRLTESQRRNLRDALVSQNTARTAAFYDAVSDDLLETPPLATGLHEHLIKLASSLSRDAAFLSGLVRRSLGEANAPTQLPPLEGELDLPGIGARAMFDQLLATAGAECDDACATYLRRTFPGDTPAAAAMRGIFGNRLAPIRPFDPVNRIHDLFAGATAKMLTLNIVRGAKKLATEPYVRTQFAIDRKRQVDVHLPGGALLSTDPAVAADELARFVTGRRDAAYAALGDAEKTKVHLVMSLLTQESTSAVFTALALSLDPNGTTTTFSYGGGTQTHTFHLERNAEGGITVRFEAIARPTQLLVDLDTHPLGAGSELKGTYTLTIGAQQLDDLSRKNFARCNNDPAENTMRAIPAVPQKLIAAVDRLPADFRLDLDLNLDTSFTATLK